MLGNKSQELKTVSCPKTPTKGFSHLDVCAGSVLTLHDYITNVQKRLGNRLWEGDGQCRCCGSFLDPQLKHAEACSPAEASREHCACVVCGMKLADPGITSERRGLTAWQSRLADIFTTAAVPGRSAALVVRVASSIAAAARGDAARAAFNRTAGMKPENFDNRTYTTARLSGQRTGGRILSSLEHFSTQQTSPPVATGSISRRGPFIEGGSTKSNSLSCRGGQPRLAQLSQTPLRGRSGSAQAS